MLGSENPGVTGFWHSLIVATPAVVSGFSKKAVEIGLANQIFPAESFMDEVLKYANALSQKSPLALRLGKRAMLAALDSTYDESLAREAELQKQILESEDGAEGFLSFVEKRAPVWKAR